MMRRNLAGFFLGVCLLYAGGVMAQARPAEQSPPPRPTTLPERPSTAPVLPAEVVAPEAAQQPPAPAQTPHPPMKMRQPMPPPGLGKWWKSSEVVNELQLTQEQINQLEKAFIDHRLKLINLQATLEVGEIKLEALLEEDRPDEARVVAQIDQVTSARGSLEKENAMMMLGVRRVLSIEQWKKLQEIQQSHFRMAPTPGSRKMMPRGPGHETPAPTPPQRPPESEG